MHADIETVPKPLHTTSVSTLLWSSVFGHIFLVGWRVDGVWKSVGERSASTERFAWALSPAIQLKRYRRNRGAGACVYSITSLQSATQSSLRWFASSELECGAPRVGAESVGECGRALESGSGCHFHWAS